MRVRIGLLTLGLAAGLVTGTTAAAAEERQEQSAMITGLTIPWAVGGERIARDGTREIAPGEWPRHRVEAVRLWDTRTAWLNLEPRDGRWNWRTLDAHVAKARRKGVRDITLVLAGTPRWAAIRTRPTDARWMGPGSAAPPTDPQQWSDYVRAVATRYAGRITAYEIGNEPNLPTYWNGTPAQHTDLVRRAVDEITEADPDATIVANGGVIRREKDVDDVRRWLAPLQRDDRIDAVSVHLYPGRTSLDEVDRLVDATRAMLEEVAPAGAERWVTELNVRNGSGLSSAEQREAVRSLPPLLALAGFDRVYWYAWTDLGPEDLIQFVPGTPGDWELQQQARASRISGA